MECEVSLACSQQPATYPCPEPMNPVDALVSFFKIYFSIILLSVAWFPSCSIACRFSSDIVTNFSSLSMLGVFFACLNSMWVTVHYKDLHSVVSPFL